MGGNDAGNEQGELVKATTGGQIGDRRSIEGSGDLGRGGLEKRLRSGDLNGLTSAAGGELLSAKVEHAITRNLDVVQGEWREPGYVDGQSIRADGEIVEAEGAVRTGGCRGGGVGGGTGRGDGGTRDHCACGVNDRAAELSSDDALGRERDDSDQQQNETRDDR